MTKLADTEVDAELHPTSGPEQLAGAISLAAAAQESITSESATVSKCVKIGEKSETILRFSNKNFSYSEYSCSCSCSAASSKADVLVSGSPPCTCAGTCVRRDGDARAYIYAYACGGCYGRANPTSANCPVPTARSMLQTEPVDCTCMGRGTWRSRGASCSRPRDGGF